MTSITKQQIKDIILKEYDNNSTLGVQVGKNISLFRIPDKSTIIKRTIEEDKVIITYCSDTPETYDRCEANALATILKLLFPGVDVVAPIIEDLEELFSNSLCPQLDLAIWSIIHVNQYHTNRLKNEIEKLIPNGCSLLSSISYEDVPSLEFYLRSICKVAKQKDICLEVIPRQDVHIEDALKSLFTNTEYADVLGSVLYYIPILSIQLNKSLREVYTRTNSSC